MSRVAGIYLSKVTAIHGNYYQTCSASKTGNVFCWGYNGYGGLGNDSTTTSAYPVEVVGVGGSGDLSTATAIGVGHYGACAASKTGNVYCWGYNGYGRLGNDSTTSSPAPVAADLPTLTTTVGCAPDAVTCSSGTTRPGKAVSVTIDGVTITPTGGHGSVAIGALRDDPVGSLAEAAGSFFVLSVASGGTIPSVVLDACSVAAGTSLEWWTGSEWERVAGQAGSTIIGGKACTSVTLGATSSPSLTTVERLSRSSRLGGFVFGTAG